MKRLSTQEFYNSLPRKIVGAEAVFMNEENQILVLKPSYRDGWLFPGGAVEENESPLSAAKREVKEEVGIDVVINKMIGFVYLTKKETPEECHVLFDGGVLTKEDIESIKLPADEIIDFKFVSRQEAEEELVSFRKHIIGEIYNAIESKVPFYKDI